LDKKNFYIIIDFFKKLFILDNQFIDKYASSICKDEFCKIYLSLLEPSINLKVKSESLKLFPIFDSLLTNNYKDQLEKSIEFIIYNQFPISSNDIIKETLQYIEYKNTVTAFINLLSTGNFIIIKNLILLTCKEENFKYQEKIKEFIAIIINNYSEEQFNEFTDYCMEVLLNNKALPLVRVNVIKQYLIPALIHVNCQFKIKFYSKHIKSLTKVIKEQLINKEDELCIQLNIHSSIFNILQIMYEYLPNTEVNGANSPINKAFCDGNVKNGKELLTNLMKPVAYIARSVTNINSNNEDYLKANKYYKQSSYCLIAAMLYCTQTKENFFNVFLFQENDAKNEKIWENIVDTHHKIFFKVEDGVPPKKSKRYYENIQYRKNIIRKQKDNFSSFLSASSLSQSVDFLGGNDDMDFNNQFNENETNNNENDLYNKNEIKKNYEYNETFFDKDCVNDNICMPIILKIIKKISNNSMKAPTQETTIPAWMNAILKTFTSYATHINVKIFIAKLIMNYSDPFIPYVNSWYIPLVKFISSGENFNDGFTYFIEDICNLLIKWKNFVKIENNSENRFNFSNMMNYIIKYSNIQDGLSIKVVIDIINEFLNKFKDFIDTPVEILYKFLSNKNNSDEQYSVSVINLAIQILASFVSNDIPEYNELNMTTSDSYPSETDFYSVLANYIQYNHKNVYEPASELCGLILKRLKKTGMNEAILNIITNKLELLNPVNTKNRTVDKFIICLHQIGINYEEILDKYLVLILFLFPNLSIDRKIQALEIIRLRCQTRKDTLFDELKGKELESLLKNSSENIQYLTLDIIYNIKDVLSINQIKFFLNNSNHFIKHSSLRCRNIYYAILKYIYQVNMDEEIKNSVKVSLLNGLADSDEEIRNNILSIWHDSSLVDSTFDLFDRVLNSLYSSETESIYLSYATPILLLSLSDLENSLFKNSLPNAIFGKNKKFNMSFISSSMDPLFTSSQNNKNYNNMIYSSQKELSFTPTIEMGTQFSYKPSYSQSTLIVNFEINNLNINTIKSSNKNSISLNNDNNDKTISNSQKDENRLLVPQRRRALRYKKTSNARKIFFANAAELKKKRIQKHLKLGKQAKDKLVYTLRNYKEGELPDIQIKYKEIIQPLQALAIADTDISKNLFIMILESIWSKKDEIMNDKECNQFTEKVEKCINNILQNTINYDFSFITAILTFCLKENIYIDTNILKTIGMNSNNQSLAILLIENIHLNHQEKSQSIIDSDNKRLWNNLAQLYKSIGENEIYRNIEESKIKANQSLKDAIEMEVLGLYQDALNIYSNTLENLNQTTDEYEVSLCEQGRLECYNKLGSWSDLVDNVTDISNNNIESLWDNNKKDLLNYFIRGYIKLHQGYYDREKNYHEWDDNNKNPVIQLLEDALKDNNKRDLVNTNYPYELSVISMMENNINQTRFYIYQTYEMIFKLLSNSNYFTNNNHLIKASEIQSILEISEAVDFIENINSDHSKYIFNKMISKWDTRYPSNNEISIDYWFDICENRETILNQIKKAIENDSNINNNDYYNKKLIEHKKNIWLTCSKAALEMKNFFVVATCLSKSKNYGLSKMEFSYEAIKYIVTELKTLKDSNERLKKIVSLGISLSSLYKKLEKDPNDQLLAKLYQLDSNLSSIILDDKKSMHQSLLSECQNNSKFSKFIPENFTGDTNSLIYYFQGRGLKRLLETLKIYKLHDMTEENKKIYLSIATFCDQSIKRIENSINENTLKDKDSMNYNEYSKLEIKYLLKALKYGSIEGIQLFPRLLQLIENDESNQQAFIKNIEGIEPWLFIRWIPQITALLDKDCGYTLIPLLKKIALSFPNALSYPLNISCEQYNFETEISSKNGINVEEEVKKLKEIIYDEQNENFIMELQRLSEPIHIYKDYAEKIAEVLSSKEKSSKKIENLKEYSNVIHEYLIEPPSNKAGTIYMKFSKKYKNELKKVFALSNLVKAKPKTYMNIFKKQLTTFRSDKEFERNETYKTQLKNYSNWLSEYQGKNYDREIEIPGQYDGKYNPRLKKHKMISIFNSNILVLNSLRKPKRLEIIGDDESQHLFLVKGGEDLRLDQRIQQLFNIMNDLLIKEAYCKKNNIAIKTYKVIPMTGSLGIIEWVPDTISIGSCIQEMLDDKNLITNSRNIYCDWVNSFYKRGSENVFHTMFKKASREDTINNLIKVENQIPKRLISKYLLKIIRTPDIYIKIRNEYANSLAAISICSYILGIGDRHLENILVNKNSGQLIGIDFGHAFGTATEVLAIPEMVPFRLTSQMVDCLDPLGISVLLEIPMIYIQTVLRENSEILLNAMSIFINEPLLDWRNFALRQAKQQKIKPKEEEESINTLEPPKWYPKQKLNIAERKLKGENPSNILITELENGHSNTTFLRYLKEIVKGDPKYNIRAQPEYNEISDEGSNVLSPIQQVKCLIDLATDKNILGRAWIGWSPFV
jgi:DNA-dependent protein kinase catalytic subunit